MKKNSVSLLFVYIKIRGSESPPRIKKYLVVLAKQPEKGMIETGINNFKLKKINITNYGK